MVDRVQFGAEPQPDPALASQEPAQQPQGQPEPQAPADPSGQQGAPQTPQRPHWLPEGIDSPEQLGTSYVQLQQRVAELEAAQQAPAVGDPADPQAPADPPQTPELQQSGPMTVEQMAPFEAEFIEKGGLSPESYAKLASEHGMDRGLVDSYIQSRVEQAAAQEERLLTQFGGAEKVEAMRQWAEANWDQASQNAFNAAIQGDEASLVMAMTSLQTAFDAAQGQPVVPGQNLVQGQPSSGDGLKPFASMAEVTEAMKDPRYRKDPAYIESVTRRVAAMRN